MRLAVFGATGGTGTEVIRQGLARGHEIVALARRPEALAVRHERLRVVRGDVLDPAVAPAVVDGTDAVVSVLGIGYRRHATTLYSAGTANVLAAMKAAGVRRLLVVSTSSLHVPDRSRFTEWLVIRWLLHPLLRRPYADMALMERAVCASGLDWTLVRAARLTNGRGTGTYRTAVGEKLPRCWSISRTDLAEYLVAHLLDSRAYGACIELAY